jgi:hypothetical protein
VSGAISVSINGRQRVEDDNKKRERQNRISLDTIAANDRSFRSICLPGRVFV